MVKIADNRSESSTSHALRRRRFDVFCRLLDTVERPLRILDIGGTQEFWDRMAFDDPAVEVVLLNRSLPLAGRAGFTAAVGDGRALTDIADKTFEVVFSNSVIEHLGDLNSQKAMASEVQRVGQRFWIQTPQRHFPIEAHSLLPFFQYLPLRTRRTIVRRYQPGWYRGLPRQCAADEAGAVRLLTIRELKVLFPGATLWRERFFGVTKSLVVHAGFGQS
jgi:hypothetical protein